MPHRLCYHVMHFRLVNQNSEALIISRFIVTTLACNVKMAAGESVSNPGQVSILTFDSRYFASILPYGGVSTIVVSPCERLPVKAHTLEDVSCFRPDISGYSSKKRPLSIL